MVISYFAMDLLILRLLIRFNLRFVTVLVDCYVHSGMFDSLDRLWKVDNVSVSYTFCGYLQIYLFDNSLVVTVWQRIVTGGFFRAQRGSPHRCITL